MTKLRNNPDKDCKLSEPIYQFENESMDEYIKKILGMNTFTDSKTMAATPKIKFTAKAYEGDLSRLLDFYVGTEFQSRELLSQTLKYPPVIGLDYVRNDIYVELQEAVFARGTKFQEKNVQVKACVIDAGFQIIKVIYK